MSYNVTMPAKAAILGYDNQFAPARPRWPAAAVPDALATEQSGQPSPPLRVRPHLCLIALGLVTRGPYPLL
jgi:hypothetical protein